MVCKTKETNGTFRWALPRPINLAGREVWIRAADVYDTTQPVDTTGFQLGMETTTGSVVWVDSDNVGGLPNAFFRRTYDLAQWYASDKTKTMPRTLRFPGHCFQKTRKASFRAVRMRMSRRKARPLAFDDLQIVPK